MKKMPHCLPRQLGERPQILLEFFCILHLPATWDEILMVCENLLNFVDKLRLAKRCLHHSQRRDLRYGEAKILNDWPLRGMHSVWRQANSLSRPPLRQARNFDDICYFGHGI